MQEIKHEIALHNPSSEDVEDYPISEYELDSGGNPKIDPETQQPRTTGDTYTWSLASGETKVFPKYVADYLKKIYGFLELKSLPREDGVPKEELVKRRENSSSDLTCKHCGQEVKNARGLGLHIAAKHPEALVG